MEKKATLLNMQPSVFLSTLLSLLLFSPGCTGEFTFTLTFAYLELQDTFPSPVSLAGLPVHGFDEASMADKGLEAAMARVNSVYAARYLYRPTRGYVTKVSLESIPANHTKKPVPVS